MRVLAFLGLLVGAIGIDAAVLNGWLNALCRGVNYTAPVAFYVKLHTADPGVGATAAFGDATRQAATFAVAAGGSCTTSADINWTNLTAAGTISHVSFWSAVSAGTFLGSDDLATPRTVAIGDNFTITAGQLTVAVTPVAA